MRVNLKRILSGVLAVLLLSCLMTATVSADVLDLDKRCRLKLDMTRLDENGQPEPVSGMVGLYQVATTRMRDGDQIYSVSAPFRSAHLNLSDIKDQEDLLKRAPVTYLEEHIKEYHLRARYMAEIDPNGVASFYNIPAGLYLVKRENSQVGANQYTMNSFLITLPRVDAEGNYDYLCEKPMKPKVELGREVIDIKVIKEWKGDKDKEKKRPDFIIVDLLNEDGQIAESKVLAELNHWTATFYDKPAEINWTVQESDVQGYQGAVGPLKLVDDHYEIVITNTLDPESPLAQTGQLNWPVPVLVTGGLLLILGGYVLSHEKKKM